MQEREMNFHTLPHYAGCIDGDLWRQHIVRTLLPWPFVMALVFSASTGVAEVKLPAVFSDHMVVQADMPVAVWGCADPGEEVAVSLVGQSAATKAGADGKWTVRLGKLQASDKPQTLVVHGANTVTIRDVLVGEVWLACGQSNMEMRIKDPRHGSVDRADQEIAAANYPQIRMFVPEANYEIYETSSPPQKPLVDRAGKWRVCSPENVAGFSAIGYFFARDLHQQLHAPVAILLAAVGGTPIEAWTSLDAQRAEPTIRPVLDDWQKRLANYDPQREQAAFLQAKQAWLKKRAEAVKAGQTPPKAPAPFKNLQVMAPGGLFNGLIAPLVPYTLRGVIWYQGERNAGGPLTGYYGMQLKTLIHDWRTRWGSEIFFAWVQLPRFQKEQREPSEPNGWGVAVREAMRLALTIPHTGMAITIDLGGVTDGHPTNKSEYATRLSRLALHDVYAQPILLWTGPLFRSAARDGNRMILSFDHAEGLRARSGELKGFAIAGDDQKFAWAKAKIDDGKVIVWNDGIRMPIAVRYAWAGNPIGNMINAAGLPASPFCTDDGN